MPQNRRHPAKLGSHQTGNYLSLAGHPDGALRFVQDRLRDIQEPGSLPTTFPRIALALHEIMKHAIALALLTIFRVKKWP